MERCVDSYSVAVEGTAIPVNIIIISPSKSKVKHYFWTYCNGYLSIDILDLMCYIRLCIGGDSMTDVLIPDVLDPGFSYDKESHKESFTYKDIPDFHMRVKSCMGIGPNAIEDSVIDYPENAPMAERRVKSMLPNWAELDDDKFSLFESCIIFMTCYILCPLANSRRVSKQTTPSLTLQYSDSATQPTPCDHYLDLLNDLTEEITGEETESFYGFRVTESSDCKHRVVWPTRMPH